ncbi:MAG TPA: hypothetical protein VIM08_05505 [Arthrobacter sp.]
MGNYELRVISDCPNSGPALDLFRRTLAAEGLPVEQLRLREVTSEDEAQELGFNGSPSFIAGGRDLFPSVIAPALSCRVYPSEHGLAGLPSPESLRGALRGTSSKT